MKNPGLLCCVKTLAVLHIKILVAVKQSPHSTTSITSKQQARIVWISSGKLRCVNEWMCYVYNQLSISYSRLGRPGSISDGILIRVLCFAFWLIWLIYNTSYRVASLAMVHSYDSPAPWYNLNGPIGTAEKLRNHIFHTMAVFSSMKYSNFTELVFDYFYKIVCP